MKLINYVFLSMLILFTVSCASPRYDIRLLSGAPIANPNYVLQDTSDLDMVITFWFTAFTTVEDKDGTIIYVPHTMAMNQDNILDEKFKKVIITVEVYNPKNITYSLAFDSKYHVKSRNEILKNHGVAAISHLKYRHYSLDLPLSKGLLDCTFLGKIVAEGETLFRLGPFDYRREVINGNTASNS